LKQRSTVARAAAICLGLCLPQALLAEAVICPGGGFSVYGAGHRADAVCQAALEATEQLASCNLYVPTPVAIEVTRSMPGNCYGLYHCDEDLIQLLPLEVYETHLSGAPDSPFGHLEPEVFFNSILRHELAHAALGTLPCPYEGCPATQEFVAYTMQIRFLSDADRAPLDQRAAKVERPITRDGISAAVLMLSPEAFIANAHAYLSQQEDACDMIGAIARGDVIFDLPFR
jgi:hypothetical protein